MSFFVVHNRFKSKPLSMMIIISLISLTSTSAFAQKPTTPDGEAILTVRYIISLIDDGNSGRAAFKPGDDLAARRVDIIDSSAIPLRRYRNWRFDSNCDEFGYPDLAWDVYNNIQPADLLLSGVQFSNPFITYLAYDPNQNPEILPGVYVEYSGLTFDWEFDPTSIVEVPGFSPEEQAALLNISGNQRTATTVNPVRFFLKPRYYSEPYDTRMTFEFTQTFSCSELFN